MALEQARLLLSILGVERFGKKYFPTPDEADYAITHNGHFPESEEEHRAFMKQYGISCQQIPNDGAPLLQSVDNDQLTFDF